MELRFGEISGPVASQEVTMFDACRARLAAVGTSSGGIEFFGLLALHGLIELGGGELA